MLLRPRTAALRPTRLRPYKLLALALGFALRSAVFGSKAIEPLAFIAGPLCLLAASLVACYLPARRASTIEPIAALHYE